jgi:hypothetical protein
MSFVKPSGGDIQFLKKDREVVALNGEFSEACDALNDFWKKAEAQLSALQIPVACRHVYNSVDFDPEYESETEFAIGWRHHLTGWRICHCSYPADEPEKVNWRPILECSAKDRMEAVDGFPALRKLLLESAKAYVEKVREAAAKLEAALALN